MISNRSGNPLLRLMEPRDLEAVSSQFVRLYRHLNGMGYLHRLNEPGVPDYLRLLMDSKRNAVLVVEEDGGVAAFLTLLTQPVSRKFTADYGRFTGIGGEMFIEEPYRGRGYAPMMLSWGEDFFRGLGVRLIDLTVVKENLRSLNIWLEMGYKEKTIGLVKLLD